MTLYQPHAWAVGYLGKDVENRPILPPLRIGERFAVHGGQNLVVRSLLSICQETNCRPINLVLPGHEDMETRGMLTTGAVAAVATLGGWVKVHVAASGRNVVIGRSGNLSDQQAEHYAASRWAFGKYLWVLDQVLALPAPVLCSGAQGAWTLPADVEAAVLAQLQKGAS
ncbi:MAG TPA: hypothetical protein PLI83_02715 [Thermomonas sp.]|nr:hypothetical protein [Thermomonas sp.]